jgi:CubicO group peptidase (beta-lactamase class C family)
MTFKSKIKSLVVVVLLSGCGSLAAVAAQEHTEKREELAPKATAAEAELSFPDVPTLDKAFIDTNPEDRKDGIPVGELGVDGGNRDEIVKLGQEIASGKYDSYDSLLIAHKGKLLFESYYQRGRVNLPHPQASATKSYTSLVLGRAIQLGYLTMADLDKPLVGFLKDLDPKKFVEGAEKITLHKAMNMRSGIRITEEKRRELNGNPSQLKGQGQVQAYLQNSAPITEESQSYLYSWDQDLVMQVIEAVVPDTAEDFIRKELLDKLGITNYRWPAGVSGLPAAGAFAEVTSRAMVKLGTLVINKGKWEGEQLIPAEYIAKATSGFTRATAEWQPENYFYGYFWYQVDIPVGNKNYNTKLAWGGGGQRIIVIEELDLVIVLTGYGGSLTIMDAVSDVVLPAFAK